MANKITVCVGDTDESLYSYAITLDQSAQLITSKNFQNLQPGTYYTSLGDLSDLAEFAEVLRQASEIIYCPPKIWSDEISSQSDMKKWTEDYIKAFSYTKKVIGFSTTECDEVALMTYLVDQRKTQYRQIWIAGCSISHGVGVKSDQKYGHLISQKLDLNASFLTRSGSSILWAADQLLRSDIQKGDIIFWGITSPGRLTYWDGSNEKIVSCGIHSWNEHKSYLNSFIQQKFFVSEIVIYQSISAIMQVINFCEKIGIQLILATLLPGMEKYIKIVPNFLSLTGLYGRNRDYQQIDIGEDGYHPGPKSHQHYADQMLKKYYQLYGTK
jgi:hypothetical protein